ncbi:FAD-binding oxidoreductase [Aestuariivirga sp.]|uniref:FAD-binding oxidoreductase n=1 Tax=Aestuariivirga sp. TaxID=2650926 RepID=UPI003BAC0B76
MPLWRDETTGLVSSQARLGRPLLATGFRRSYGDSCLNTGGALLDMTSLARIMAFDPSTRLLRAEAGASFDLMLQLIVPRGFFLPVVPGTRFVTLGGAIANDVHGKNHHRNGTLGRWVKRLMLLRSDGQEIELTPDDPTGLFQATIGGLGLTGIILWAEIETIPIASSLIEVETIPFEGIGEFFRLAKDSETGYEHNVAWIDCVAGGKNLGRGIFTRGNHAPSGPRDVTARAPKASVPCKLPGYVLNQHTMGAFNSLYFNVRKHRAGPDTVSMLSFFHPLDGVGHWNRIYGPRGMYQYQSIIPPASQEEATCEMLKTISASGQASFLAVLKTLGRLPSPGLLSFPREGTTLALDFPNRGETTLRLMARLDEIVLKAGGRLYPAKDGRMPARMFKAGYPDWDRFAPHIDPGVRSDFLARVTAT